MLQIPPEPAIFTNIAPSIGMSFKAIKDLLTLAKKTLSFVENILRSLLPIRVEILAMRNQCRFPSRGETTVRGTLSSA